MSAHCCHHSRPPEDAGAYRRVLWIALAINAAMFLVELIGGLRANSVSLQADALDFLADAANYGISLFVLGMALRWRARAALVKGVSMGLFGIWVLGSTGYHATHATVPAAEVMGAIGLLALIANVAVAAMLFAWRRGDSNMRSVWLCSRNDAISNLAVLAAASGVFATGTGWPDIAVAAIMATLALAAAVQVIRRAREELRRESPAPVTDGVGQDVRSFAERVAASAVFSKASR